MMSLSPPRRAGSCFKNQFAITQGTLKKKPGDPAN